MALSFTIIGMSDSQRPFFSPEVLRIIAEGKVFSGGKRHYGIVKEMLPTEHKWIEITVPLEEVYRTYRREKGEIIIFVSGDPLFFGFGATLQRVMPGVPMRVFPYFNSLQLLSHRLLLPYHDMTIVSLTGRDWKEFDNTLIEHKEKIGVLTDNNKTPGAIARRMLEYGFNFYKMRVGEKLGNAEEEKVATLSLEEAAGKEFGTPNCIILQITENHPYRRFGIPENEFHLLDGRERMITKMPIRILSLQKMELYSKKNFWDVGFCTGSISIEARLAFNHLNIKAFEIREEGRELMGKNSRKFSAPGIEYVIGDFLKVEIPENERCDAAFIGGHGGHLKEIMNKIYAHLTLGGCIVLNSVTAESKEDFISTAKDLNMKILESTHIELDNNNPIDILKAEK